MDNNVEYTLLKLHGLLNEVRSLLVKESSDPSVLQRVKSSLVNHKSKTKDDLSVPGYLICEHYVGDNDTVTALVQAYLCIEHHISQIKRLLRVNNKTTIESQCQAANSFINAYLRTHGVIVRSTHVRNSFELYEPLRRICNLLAAKQLKRVPSSACRLIFSAEWDLSPLRYKTKIDFLSKYALIGLPASECGNALICPLFAHELGHLIWSRFSYKDRFPAQISDMLNQRIADTKGRYLEAFGKPVDLTDMLSLQVKNLCTEYINSQLEETFCDIVGVYLFGASYLYSFEYLVSSLTLPRKHSYPSLRDRVSNLLKACETFSQKKAKIIGGSQPGTFYDVSQTYAAGFFYDGDNAKLSHREEYLMGAADFVTGALLNSLIELVEEHSLACGWLFPEEDQISLVRKHFSFAIPANSHLKDASLHSYAKRFVEVVNAGWLAYFDANLWSESKYAAFKDKKMYFISELMLKSIEVLEFNYLQKS